MKTGAFIVTYHRKDGKIQKALLYHADQTPVFKGKGKALLRCVDDNLEPQIINDKPELVVVQIRELKNIGFIN